MGNARNQHEFLIRNRQSHFQLSIVKVPSLHISPIKLKLQIDIARWVSEVFIGVVPQPAGEALDAGQATSPAQPPMRADIVPCRMAADTIL
jgi:hypothetical protein